MLTTLILADDLTGALDSLAPFASLGMQCLVAISPDDLALSLANAPEVLAINLGSREASPEQARMIAVATAVAARRAVGHETIWFKKIDSRMKGHIAAEVTGVRGVIGAANVLMCPAIPELGRIVIGGNLRGEGVVAPIPVSTVLPDDITVNTPDAGTDGDLDRIVQANAKDTLFVGARGLAAALARSLRPGLTPTTASMPHGPVGFCVGSRDPVTLAQVAALTKSSGVSCVLAPDGIVPPIAADIVQATQGTGASAKLVSNRLAQGMQARLAGIRTLVVTGGETAAALFQMAGIRVLRVEGEVLPGLPLCHAVGGSGFPAFVTKSGGFGQADTLLQLWLAAHSKEDHLWR